MDRMADQLINWLIDSLFFLNHDIDGSIFKIFLLIDRLICGGLTTQPSGQYIFIKIINQLSIGEIDWYISWSKNWYFVRLNDELVVE